MKIILIILGAVVVLTIISYIFGTAVYYFDVKTTGNISNNITDVLIQENQNCNM